MINIKQSHSTQYSPRTYHNATSAQLTVAFACDMQTAGEMLTKKAASGAYLGYVINSENIKNSNFIAETAREIIRDFNMRGGSVLNIAGNGIYTLIKYGISQDDINEFVYNVLSVVVAQSRVKKIISGGQTGVDIAAAVACQALHFDCEITLPKGLLMRGVDGIDKKHSVEKIQDMIHQWENVLKARLAKSTNILPQEAVPIERGHTPLTHTTDTSVSERSGIPRKNSPYNFSFLKNKQIR